MKRRIHFKRTLALLLALILALPLSALAEAAQSNAAEAVEEPAGERTEVSEATEPELDAPDIPAEADELPLPEPEAEATDEPAPEEDGATAALSVRVEPGEGAVLRAVIEADGEADCRWQAVERDAYIEALSNGADAEALWADIEGAQGDALDAAAAFGERYAEYCYRCVARVFEREAASEPYSFPDAPAEDAPVEAPEEGEPAGEEVTGEIHPLFAEELSFAEDKINIGKGETYRPALRSEGAGTLFFESSKPGVFSVDSRTGEITGIKTGKGALTVSDGLRDASVPVQVYAAPKKFSLLPGELTMGVGEEVALQPKLPSKTAGHIVSGSSSDAGVATVEGQTVRAVAEGEATITAELFNGKRATCKVTVLRAPEAGMMYLHTPMGRDNYEMGVGETMQITLSYPEGYAGGYTFSSGDESVISIDARSGKATAHSVGRATIYATAYNGVQDQREFTVKAKPSSLSIQSVPKTMGVGEEFDLFPALSNKAGEECGGGATYKSSKPGVVQVLLYSGYAHLVAKKTGKAKITVTTYNKLKKSVTITVKKAPTEIEIEPDELELGVGESGVKLKPVFKKKGSFANVRWSSEKPDVVRVDEKGVLIPVAPGSARVRGEISLRDADGNTETIGSSSNVTVKPAPVEGDGELSFPQVDGAEKLTLGVGETMRAELIFGNGAGGGRKFKSSKKGVASVDASGLVKGKKTGKATITATMYNGVRLSKTIQVVSAPKKIEITNLPPAGFNLRYGEQWDLDVRITDKKKKTIEGVGYTFEDDGLYNVHVDPATGVVTGDSIESGSAKITVKAYNGKKASVTIRFGEPEDGLDIFNGENKRTPLLELTAGQSEQLHVAIPYTPEPQNVKWWSGDESVARVEGGRVIAVSEGRTFIYASADDPNEPGRRLTKDCYVTVKKPVYGISLDHSSLTLTQGQRATLTATLTGLDGVSASSIRWESSDARVVNVSNGELEALSSGTATVTASLDDPNAPGNVLKAECLVTVERAPFGISLDRTELKLMAGQRATLTATLTNLPGASQSDVTWQSSDDGVATVQAGSVKAVAEGSATITASIEDPEEPGSILQAQCLVTVERAPFGISLDRTELKLMAGQRATLTATLTNLPGASQSDVTWKSSDDGVATVQAGEVQAIAAGSATITASIEDPEEPGSILEAQCQVTVEKATYGIFLDRGELTLYEGGSAALTASLTGFPEGEEPEITWSSSRDDVATVQGGTVSAVAPGTATITASAANPLNPEEPLTAECAVTVGKIFALSAERLSLEAGDTATLTATLRGEAIPGESITWTSGRDAVATVQNGLVTAVAGGEAVIRARMIDGGKSWSAECTVSVIADWQKPPKPEPPKITEEGRVELQWEAPVTGDDASESYAVYEIVNGVEVLRETVTGTNAFLSGVSAGEHTYVIRPRVRQGGRWEIGEASSTVTVLVEEWAASPQLDSEDVGIGYGYSYYSDDFWGEVTLNWIAIEGAEKYIVYEVMEDNSISYLLDATDTHCKVKYVLGGEHSYAVQAVVNGRGSYLSNIVSVNIYTIRLDWWEEKVEIGETTSFGVNLNLPEGADRTITWSSSDESIATVNESGEITGISSGMATITATCSNGLFDHSLISVYNSPVGQQDSDFVIEDGVLKEYMGTSEYVVIPETVRSIDSGYGGIGVFNNCSTIKGVVIDDNIENVDIGTFEGCTNLEDVRIPYCAGLGLRYISPNMFARCSSLKHIHIPDSIITIFNGAFSGCSSLENITLPPNIYNIGDFTFSGCSSLKSAILPNGLSQIGEGAFSGCKSLNNITLSEGLRTIGDNAFINCKSLTSVVIPSSVTSIGESAFSGCTGLESVTIQGSNVTIGKNAFAGCTGLKKVSIVGKALIEESAPASYAAKSSGSNGVSIGEKAFSGCSDLTNIVLSGSVTGIETGAFSDCTKLTGISIPSSVTSIGDSAFSGCSSLSNVKMNKGLTKIGSSAFKQCGSLKSVVIPDSVTSIGNNVFEDCSILTFVTWPESVRTIPQHTFLRCGRLNSLMIPDGVISILRGAFFGCTGLSNLGIPESVTSIEEFEGDESIPSTTVIMCYPGSYGETWAFTNGNPIEYVGISADDVIWENNVLIMGSGMVINLSALGIQMRMPNVGYSKAGVAVINLSQSNMNNVQLRSLKPGETTISLYASDEERSFKVKVVGFERRQMSVPINGTVSQTPIGISGTWSSSNESVASVDQNGVVTGISKGVTTIKLTQGNRLWASYSLSVGSAATSITADPAYLLLGAVGDSESVYATVKNGEACSDYSFSSANPAVASVSADGRVTAEGEGRTQIIISSKDNSSVKAYCDVVVLRGIGTSESVQEMLNDIQSDYIELLAAHARFNGSFIDINGHVHESIDLSKYTNSLEAQVFDLLGENVQGVDIETTRGLYITDQILSGLSKDYNDPVISASAIKTMLEALGVPEADMKYFMKYALGVDDIRDIKLKDLKKGKIRDWLEKHASGAERTFDIIKKYSIALEIADVGSLIYEAFAKLGRYSQISRADLEKTIDTLSRANDPQFKLVIELLKRIKESQGDLVIYIASSMGFTKLQSTLIDKLQGLLSTKNPIFLAIQVFIFGIDSFWHVSAKQSAAFELKYAVGAATACLTAFNSAYEQFMENPANEGAYQQYYSALSTFAGLVATEYDAYSEFLGEASDDLFEEFSDDSDLHSCEEYASKYREIPTYHLEYFKWQCDGDEGIGF